MNRRATNICHRPAGISWVWRFFPWCFTALSALALLPAVFAQTEPAAGAASQDLTALVREVVQNEIHDQMTDNTPWCFRERKQDEGNAPKTVEVCETKDGDLERLISVNGHGLSTEDAQAEDDRIKKLVERPASLRAKQKKQHDDDEQMRTLLKAVPDAFRFQYVGSEGNLVKMYFRPNPDFRAPARAATAFRHMEGVLVVDREQKRIAEINGRLSSEVKFLGGLLGHLDQGGTFFVKAGEVAPGHWDVMLMNLNLSGRALFFKTIAVHQFEQYSDYTPVPANASLRDVADLLKKECSSIHTASASAE